MLFQFLEPKLKPKQNKATAKRPRMWRHLKLETSLVVCRTHYCVTMYTGQGSHRMNCRKSLGCPGTPIIPEFGSLRQEDRQTSFTGKPCLKTKPITTLKKKAKIKKDKPRISSLIVLEGPGGQGCPGVVCALGGLTQRCRG